MKRVVKLIVTNTLGDLIFLTDWNFKHFSGLREAMLNVILSLIY